MAEVLNKHHLPEGWMADENKVYVGRGTKWGNPFRIGEHGNREQVIHKFRIWLQASPLYRDLHELTGKDLVCFCAPLPCHADVLLELAKGAVSGETWRRE